jgi:hypothetical protein
MKEKKDMLEKGSPSEQLQDSHQHYIQKAQRLRWR